MRTEDPSGPGASAALHHIIDEEWESVENDDFNGKCADADSQSAKTQMTGSGVCTQTTAVFYIWEKQEVV